MIGAEIDSPEFVAQLAGRFRDFERLSESVATLVRNTSRRIASMQRNAYLSLAEIGDGLLQVQECRPGEFEDWFELHQSTLGFSLRTAERCKAAARLVIEYGIEKALALALDGPKRDRPEPFLSLTLRLPVSPEQIPAEQVSQWVERLRPAVTVFQQLQARIEPRTA